MLMISMFLGVWFVGITLVLLFFVGARRVSGDEPTGASHAPAPRAHLMAAGVRQAVVATPEAL